MKTPLSPLRQTQYQELSKVILEGSILDLGGSKKSGYQGLVQGSNTYTTANYGELHPGADIFFDAESIFPLNSESYDNVLAMNFLEHIFNYHGVFNEVSRILKKGGLFVSSTPFMHHIHGSPNDYHRYTESTYLKLADQYNFEVISIIPLGKGIFSLIYQSVGGWIPTFFLKSCVKYILIFIDSCLGLFKPYKKLQNRIPLGYFVILKKK